MLEKPKTDKQALNLTQRLRDQWQKLGFIEATSSAVSGGVRRSAPYVGSEIGEKEDEYVPAPPQAGNPFRTSSVAPTAMPAPPPVPAQRVAPPTDTLASAAPPPPPPAASGPVNRQQYAALFPNDVASGLIRQQGIGSLMG